MSNLVESLLPCPFCKNPPGTKVGPPAMARCISSGCEGYTLGATTFAEWNTRATPSQSREAAERAGGQLCICGFCGASKNEKCPHCTTDERKTDSLVTPLSKQAIAEVAAYDRFLDGGEYIAPSGAVAAEPVGWLWHSQDNLEWKYSHGPKEPECWKVRQPVYANPPVRGDRETIARVIDPLPFAKLKELDDRKALPNVRGRSAWQARANTALEIADDILALSLSVQSGAGERGSDAAEADRYFDMAGEFGHQLQALASVAQDAIDLLTERKQGNAARSPGHNARVILEAAMKRVSPSAHPSRQPPPSSSEGERR